MITPYLIDEIEKHFKQSILNQRLLTSGHNASIYVIDMSDGKKIVKLTKTDSGTLETEAFMLKYLYEKTDLPVPEVHLCDEAMIVMDFIENDRGMTEKAENDAARKLAKLHNIKGESFGFERDTVIGPLHQPNTPEKSWLTFFTEHRLLYSARKALDESRINKESFEKVEKLASKISLYLTEPDHASLIHGDLWQGNVLTIGDDIAGFIDPAIYFADPEIELAFSTMFGTFKKSFYETYNTIRPIQDGFWEIRRDIYNLYPLLVHMRLYDGQYMDDFLRIINKLV